MVGGELRDPAVQVAEDWSVARQHEVGLEAAHGSERFEVAGERAGLRLGPDPDVRRDAEHHVVRGVEYAAPPVVEHQLVVGVARGVDDPRRPVSHGHLLPGTQGQYLLRQPQPAPHRPGRGLRHLPRHPVPHEQPHERLRVGRPPEPAGEGYLRIHHKDRRRRDLLQPPRRPDVVWVEVRDHHPPDVAREVAAGRAGPCLPRLAAGIFENLQG